MCVVQNQSSAFSNQVVHSTSLHAWQKYRIYRNEIWLFSPDIVRSFLSMWSDSELCSVMLNAVDRSARQHPKPLAWDFVFPATKALGSPSGFGLLRAAKPRLFHHPLMSNMKHKQMLRSFAVRVPKSVPKHGRSPSHCIYSTQISQRSVQILTGAAWTLHCCKVHLAIMHMCARIEIILYLSLTCWQSSSRIFGNFYKNLML